MKNLFFVTLCFFLLSCSRNDGDFMNCHNLKYMDDSYIYFTAEPTMMKEAGLSDRFPILNTLDVNDNIVILKCKLKTKV